MTSFFCVSSQWKYVIEMLWRNLFLSGHQIDFNANNFNAGNWHSSDYCISVEKWSVQKLVVFDSRLHKMLSMYLKISGNCVSIDYLGIHCRHVVFDSFINFMISGDWDCLLDGWWTRGWLYYDIFKARHISCLICSLHVFLLFLDAPVSVTCSCFRVIS